MSRLNYVGIDDKVINASFVDDNNSASDDVDDDCHDDGDNNNDDNDDHDHDDNYGDDDNDTCVETCWPEQPGSCSTFPSLAPTSFSSTERFS